MFIMAALYYFHKKPENMKGQTLKILDCNIGFWYHFGTLAITNVVHAKCKHLWLHNYVR